MPQPYQVANLMHQNPLQVACGHLRGVTAAVGPIPTQVDPYVAIGKRIIPQRHVTDGGITPTRTRRSCGRDALPQHQHHPIVLSVRQSQSGIHPSKLKLNAGNALPFRHCILEDLDDLIILAVKDGRCGCGVVGPGNDRIPTTKRVHNAKVGLGMFFYTAIGPDLFGSGGKRLPGKRKY